MPSIQSTANSTSLPTNFVIPLSQVSLLQASGEDRLKYLQGQLTQDLERLTTDKAMYACHCDAKGKAWALYQVFSQGEEMFMLSDSEAIEKSLPELKKYAVFSKVALTKTDLTWFGIVGPIPEAWLTKQGCQLPQTHLGINCTDRSVIIRQDSPDIRYIVGLHKPLSTQIVEALSDHLYTENLWQMLDIQAGLPKLNAQTSAEFVPQMVNMQALDAISFTKGCYMGQETVARTRYLGKNKRAAYILHARHATNMAPGDALEVQLEENWRRSGTVLSCATLSEETWLLAVLPNDTQTGTLLRSKQQPDVLFEVLPLPYSLEN
ncbi:tRNA-modifying protein YgfZ [Bowmanella denitrificans]|uniref:tRNA-modifying protein YgfZ n=1 Tax=Bowmanella denitrificans TaxID=366582 RepID=UPI000C9BDB9F|nr:tRNA-modifying protein YgfZ [Bowmanella denitrificans]